MKKQIVIALALFPIASLCQTISDIIPESTSPAHYYYPNEGQIVDENGDPVDDILYIAQHGTPTVYLGTNKVYFQSPYIGPNLMDSAVIDSALLRLNMTFICDYQSSLTGGGEEYCEPTIEPFDMTSNVINYYYDHCPNGILNVPGYESVVYSNVFDDIDIHFTSNEAAMKAFIVIQPGADPNDITFLFEGQDSIGVDSISGWLEMYMDDEGIKFPQATAYQIDGGGSPYPVAWLPVWNDLGGGYVSIGTGSYNPAETLVIRLAGPVQSLQSNENNLYWSTYFGTAGFEEARDIENGSNTNNEFYVLMSTNNSTFITLTPGAHIISFKGGIDLHLSRFSSTRNVEWETFYGSKSNEQPQEMEYSTSQNKIYVVGVWDELPSPNNQKIPFPGSNNGTFKQTIPGSGSESFILSFTTNGVVYWASYFGGTGADLVQAIDIDDQNAVLNIAGSTSSSTTNNSCSNPTGLLVGFPICNVGATGYWQQTFAGGSSDGFIASFNMNDNSLVYSTYFGGNGDDVIRDIRGTISTDGILTGEVPNEEQDSYDAFFYICGFTTTLTNGSFPRENPGSGAYYQSVNSSVRNGFISYFNNQELLWSTYIGGESEDDMMNLEVKPDGDVYVVGRTMSPSKYGCSYNVGDKIPYCNSNGISYIDSLNDDDLYIARFNEDHQMTWATTYGSDESSEQSLVLADVELGDYGSIFVVGNTRQEASMTQYNYTSKGNGQNYLQSQNLPVGDNKMDGYILMFHNNNKIAWATYFGGDSDDQLNAAEYKNGKLRIAGSSESPSRTPSGPRSFPVEDPGGVFFDDLAKAGSTKNGTITEFAVSTSLLIYLDVNEISEEAEQLLLYPNPVNELVNISIFSEKDRIVTMKIIDMKGSLIHSESISLQKGNNTHVMNIDRLNDGMYILNVTDFSTNLNRNIRFIKGN